MVEVNMRKPADLILCGATIFSGKALADEQEFIAIAGNRIIGMGKSDEVRSFRGEQTKVISLEKEQMIMPGLHDHHIHLIQAGMLDKYVDLTGTSSQEEAAQLAADFAASIPEGEWVMGFGWSRQSWVRKDLPTKHSLDKLIADRPVFLLDSELHGAWVNSKALELCGISAETADPDFGEIARDQEGQPSGYLYETALTLVGRSALDFQEELVEELIKRYMRKAVKWGITSVSDMTPYLGLDLAYEKTYLAMDQKGELDIRINAARNLFEEMDHFLHIRRQAEESGSGMYRVPYMKQFLDGVIANYTALMLNSYSTCPGERGGSLLDMGRLDKAVETAHAHHVSVRLHACGDGAVRAALDAYEAVIKKQGQTSARHQIEHIESIDPADFPRFKELGVIASVQPEHIVSGIPSFADNSYPQLLGADRVKSTWPFRSLLQQGAVLAFGSDAPVVEGNPFHGMYCGLERIHPDGSPVGGWNPQEKLTIEELIHGYTYGGAYAEGRENELGTLEVGKLADLTVVDRNLLTASSAEIRETEVLLTIVDGRIVYEKGDDCSD